MGAPTDDDLRKAVEERAQHPSVLATARALAIGEQALRRLLKQAAAKGIEVKSNAGDSAFHALTDEDLRKVVQARVAHPSALACARALGWTRGKLDHRLREAQRRGIYPAESPQAVADADERRDAQRGSAPDHDLTHELPPGLALKGTSVRYDSAGNVQQYWNKSKLEGREPEAVVQLPDPKKIVKLSTLYDQTGNVSQQWISEKPDLVAREALWAAFADALKSGLPQAEPTDGPDRAEQNLMACYPVGDHHLGMLSWDKETGANYDLSIGERLLTSATDYLVEAAPACERATIVFLGDFMHYDSFEAVTPTSRNILDADSRYPKMVRAAIRSMRYLIERAAQRHRQVHVVVEIGNHDLSSSIFLMECLHNIYQQEPRVTIDTSPSHFHYFDFGKVLVGTHHGHGVKMEGLPLVMAHDRPADWGRTRFRYWWTGHIHHSKTRTVAHQAQDYNGCSVESFRVLAPVDAWAAQKGYRPIRDMTAIVLHREFGEVARHKVNPDMLMGHADDASGAIHAG